MKKQCGDRRILKANWRYIAELCIAVPIIFTVLFGVTMFGKNLLMTFPLGIRMMLMLVMQWSLLVVPVILMAKNRWTLSDLGFTKERLAGQILIGVLLAVLMSAVFTVIPILAGFESSVVGNQYTQVWQFAFDFVYKLAAVALAEEIVFRGYIYRLLTKIWDNEWFAII
ncbi:MAG: CPBP family intramembrane metalloprotease, partial [Clostridia bacterium]|nr:CPBP family intramembrane metalloprotease [Clostridia bacterium]